MRRPVKRPARWAALCRAALLALAFAAPLTAAPAPIPRAPREAARTQRANLVGTWTLYWHGAKGTVTLEADGGYRCLWCGMEFVGNWKLCDGRVTITESYRPSDSNSWHTFTIELGLSTSDARAAAIRLERPR